MKAWPLSQDEAECELLACLRAMSLPRDDKLLIAEMRKRGIWVYRIANSPDRIPKGENGAAG